MYHLFSPFGSNPQLSFIPILYFLIPALSSSLSPFHSTFHIFFSVAAVFCYPTFFLLGTPSCCWMILWTSLSTKLFSLFVSSEVICTSSVSCVIFSYSIMSQHPSLMLDLTYGCTSSCPSFSFRSVSNISAKSTFYHKCSKG